MNFKSLIQNSPLKLKISGANIYVYTLGVALVYYVGAQIGLTFSFENTNATPIWPPSGFAFAALLFFGYRIWPGIFLGAFFANCISLFNSGSVSSQTAVLVSLFIGLGNTLEAIFGFFIINKVKSSQEIFKFAFVSLVMCLVSASIGSVAVSLGGIATWSSFKNVWFTWWLGDVSGILLFTPLLLAWKTGAPIRKNFWWWIEITLLTFLIIMASRLIFESLPSTLATSQAYLLIPLLLWGVFRFGEQMALTLGVLVSIMAIWGTVHGKGPFSTQSLNDSLLSLQGFICMMSVTMMAVAATIQLKKEAENRLHENNELLEKKVQSRTLILEQKTQELIHTNAELEQINRITIDREERIIELKQNINELSLHRHKQPPYDLTYLTRKEPPLHFNNLPAQNSGKVETGEKDEVKRRLIMQSLLEDIYEANSKSSARLAAIVESSDDAIVAQSLEGIITTWNYGAEHIYGYKAQEIIGRPASILLAPGHVDQMPKMIDQVKLGESIHHYETVCLRKDGKLIDVSLTISPVRDKGKIIGVSAIARDITGRKRAEETFRRVVESVPSGIVIVNSQGKIVLVNLQAERMFGYSREELLGNSVEFLMPKRFSAGHPTYRKGYIANPSARRMGAGRDLVGLHKDGHEIPIEIGLNPIETDEGVHILSSIIDITERKRLEQLKDNFLSTVSHELRTPLAILKIGVDNLEAGRFWSLNNEEKEMAETLKRNAERLEKLINDLLDLSRLESDQTKKNLQNVNMDLLVDEVFSGVQILAEQQNIVLKKDIGNDLPKVWVDPDLIMRVLANLLNNALRFAKSRIIVSLHLIDQHLKIGICDDGEGINPDHISSLFNKFVQINRPVGGSGYKGTGLGLAICREIIELHQGKIWAESTIGEGSKFHFIIPLNETLTRTEERIS